MTQMKIPGLGVCCLSSDFFADFSAWLSTVVARISLRLFSRILSRMLLGLYLPQRNPRTSSHARPANKSARQNLKTNSRKPYPGDSTNSSWPLRSGHCFDWPTNLSSGCSNARGDILPLDKSDNRLGLRDLDVPCGGNSCQICRRTRAPTRPGG